MPDPSNVTPLVIAKPGNKDELLALVDNLRAGIVADQITGLLVTVILTDGDFDSYSVADVAATQRIGYLMAHVAALTDSMRVRV